MKKIIQKNSVRMEYDMMSRVSLFENKNFGKLMNNEYLFFKMNLMFKNSREEHNLITMEYINIKSTYNLRSRT